MTDLKSRYYVDATVSSGRAARSNAIVSVAADFDQLLWHASEDSPFNPRSLEVFEVDQSGDLSGPIPAQFDNGQVTWLMQGHTPADATRCFRIGFDSVDGPHMSRLRYAVIGCGRRGAAHLAVASQLTDSLELVAVCDAHLPSAEQAAAQYGVCAYTDVRELVAHESLDVCDVVVPAELHHTVSCYLSQHGVHHNVETPIAPTLGLADLMIEAAVRNNVKLQVSENFPFLPVEQMVRAVIQSGAIGQVGRCYRLFSTSGYHGLAAIRMRLGATPVAVSSCAHTMPVVPYTDRVNRHWTEEGFEFALIDFDNGGLGVIMVGNKNGCLGRNHLVGFETIGERGSIITNGNQGVRGGEGVIGSSVSRWALCLFHCRHRGLAGQYQDLRRGATG